MLIYWDAPVHIINWLKCLKKQTDNIKILKENEWSHSVPWCVLAAGVSGLAVLVAVVSGSPYKRTEGGAASRVT